MMREKRLKGVREFISTPQGGKREHVLCEENELSSEKKKVRSREKEKEIITMRVKRRGMIVR